MHLICDFLSQTSLISNNNFYSSAIDFGAVSKICINRPMLYLLLFDKRKQATFFFKKEQIILTSAVVKLVHIKHSIIHLLATLMDEQDLVR